MAETCRHGVVGVDGRQTMNESSGSVEVTRTLEGKQGVSVVELSRAGARKEGCVWRARVWNIEYEIM